MSESYAEGREQILSHVPDNTQKDIISLFNRVDKDKEFEFIFFSKRGQNMNKEKYVLLLKYIRNMARTNKLKVIIPERTLDIGYTANNERVYRISISGSDDINKIINRISNIQNKNYMIYKFLLYTLSKNTDNISLDFMMKTKEEGDTKDIDDLNMRVRLSSEYNLIDEMKSNNYKNLDENLKKILSHEKSDLETRKNMNDKIFYRLKERTSLYIEETDGYFIRIDLTDTKNTRDFRKINSTFSNYELEIEYGVKTSKNVKIEHLNKMYEISENLLKLIQQSIFIMGNTQTANVIQYYKDISNVEKNITNLVARQPVSLEIQHISEILPNKYTVTDKADGERNFLIIYNNSVYFISTNLNVKDTGIVLDKSLDKYNGTIMDGEYVFISKQKRHLFMVFDCLRNGTIDLTSTVNLKQRLDNADKIIEDCFIFKLQQGFIYKTPPVQKDDFNIDEVSKFYGQELTRFYDVLSKDINQAKQYPLIRRKYFMPVFGAKKWEIFKYSVELWKRYTEDANIKFPYHLDGLIYHPLEQAYVTNVQQSKYSEYKWKPPSKNSIDFYIEFKRDPQTGNILNVYDNSTASDVLEVFDEELGTVRNKTYRICTLYVGKNLGGKEHPVPFDQNYGVSEAYIYLKNGEVRDAAGDILSDKTVVEFYYQYDLNIIPQQRWVPIKIRYDKTEAVEKFEKRYGNYATTAEKVWRSIINPVLMDDFIELSKGNTDKRNFYDIKIKEMNAKISHQLIATVNKENKYYQKITKLAYTMRQFHNFLKSNLVYTYCDKMYHSNTQQSVLDIACGRGGDIEKFYYTKVALYVGVDIDAEGLTSQVNGAISRYNRFKKKKPNFPKMFFIQADVRAILDYETQIKILSGMDDFNKKLLERFFPTNSDTTNKQTSLFDVINCQFAMHYFLQDELSWSNFKQNLKKHLRSGGHFIATTFDAKQVMNVMGDKDSFSVYYDDSDGNKKKFFDIIKRYADPVEGQTIGVGAAIDLFTSWMFEEGNYFTEYLVDLDFIIKELEKDADLELVDSDLFSNQFEIQKKFLTDAGQYESSIETKNYIAKAASYYEDNEMNEKCIQYTNLNRYFVFRKKSPADTINITKSKKQKGGNNLDKLNKDEYMEKYNFSDVKKFKIPEMINYDDSYSMINSLHKLLVSHSIFPKSISVNEFMDDMGLKSIKDHNIENSYIKDISSHIIINHEIDEGKSSKVQNVVNGLNIFIVERDCNNFYDITYAVQPDVKSSNKAIVLMKEGALYKPVMRKEEKGIRGIFKMKDDMIKYLLESGDSV